MSDIRPVPFDCRVAPPSLVLLPLIHVSFSDRISRCAAVAAEVFSRWQLGGSSLTPALPSTLLVNAGELDPDPVWQLVGQYRGTNAPYSARRDAAVKEMRKLVAGRGVGANPSLTVNNVRAAWRQALKVGFGSARCGRYATMWDPTLGLITGASNDVVLRLDSADDIKRFRGHVRSYPKLLAAPTGWTECLDNVKKSAAVCGSVASEKWDREFVNDILANELPVLFLPHVARSRSPFQNRLGALLTEDNFISRWEHQSEQIVQMKSLPPWLRDLESAMRSRSKGLPPGYRRFLQRTIRELMPVCIKIVAQIPAEKLPGDIGMHLVFDLVRMTAWSMVAGVHCLTWHGWGLPGGVTSPNRLKVLKTLRDEGPMPRQQLKKKIGRMKECDLDKLLAVLTRYGLVMSDSQDVSAIPLARFLGEAVRSGILPPLELLTKPYYQQLASKKGIGRSAKA